MPVINLHTTDFCNPCFSNKVHKRCRVRDKIHVNNEIMRTLNGIGFVVLVQWIRYIGIFLKIFRIQDTP